MGRKRIEIRNVLKFTDRKAFRGWLDKNHDMENKCWIHVKNRKTPPEDALWYLDAVEEVLCFGLVDTTRKNISGVNMQKFAPRSRKGKRFELNRARLRHLAKMGMMPDVRPSRICPKKAL